MDGDVVYVLQYAEDSGLKRMDVFSREDRARVAAEAVARTRGARPEEWREAANVSRLFTWTGAPTEFTITMKTVR